MTLSPPLVTGKAFRVAPGQSGQPVASFWRFWVEGRELYAVNRDSGSTKISVHASGQIHMRLEKRDLQLLAPALTLVGSRWNHALEIRYLIAPDRFRPAPKRLKKEEKAFLVEVADGNALILNLMVAAAGAVTNSGPPPQFGGARQLWKSSLADGRSVLLVGRVIPLDAENQNHIERLRGVDGSKATFSGTTTSPPQMELTQVFWSPQGGNIALIVPVGEEAIRRLGKPASTESDEPGLARLEVDVACPDASCEIIAPNGAVIATVLIAGSANRVKLAKNEHVGSQLGTVRLVMHAEHLIRGQTFETPVFRLECIPTVAGVRPRDWAYSASCAYDGASLTVTIRPMSVGLLFDDRSAASSGLQHSEQIILVAPAGGLSATATMVQPEVEFPLNATLLLCDVIHK